MTKVLKTMSAAVITARPKQVLKNSIVLFPMVFTANLWLDPTDPVAAAVVGLVVAAFLIFALLSSSVYFFNDLVDAKHDREHPVKRNRPLAAGRISPFISWLITGALVIVALVASYAISLHFLWVAISYLGLNVIYTLLLRNVVILDVMSIAAGFVLRAVGGAVALNAAVTNVSLAVSPWLYVVTSMGALMLALGKRRGELQGPNYNYQPGARPVLANYNLNLIDQMLTVTAAATIVTYALYSFINVEGSGITLRDDWLLITMPITAYGVFRYLYLLHSKDKGEQPDKILLEDRPLQICVLVWIITATVVLVI